MKPIIALMAVVALLSIPGVRGEGASDSSSVLTAAVVVAENDSQLQVAHDCLARIRASKANDGDTVLVKVLDATGFTLKKVLAKQYKNDPERIRFGFEFGNRDDVKTVYWESDCSGPNSGEHLASR
jgi:hypothetical protein